MTPFGTDGIRGNATTSPYFQESFLDALGYALATWARIRTGAAPRFVLGRDTRNSGPAILETLASSITRNGGLCFNAAIITTPALQFLVTTHAQSYDYGIMITASHNKGCDNGIKISNRSGKISLSDEAFISALLDHAPTHHPGAISYLPAPIPQHQASSYAEHLRKAFPGSMLRGMRIVIDCAHGAASTIAPAVITTYGAEVISLHTTLQGDRINDGCGSTAPESLRLAVLTHKAAYGIAFDGDGDRLCMVDYAGTILFGDELLALLSTHPSVMHEPAVIGSPLINSGLDAWLQLRRKKLIRVGIGDRLLAAALEENKLSLAGEPCGHIIIRSHLPTADGLFAALMVLHVATLTKQHALSSFKRLPQETIALPAKQVKNLTEEPFASIIRAHEQELFPGRSLVRYSGTESVLRLMTEHPDAAIAREMLHTLAHQLAPYLND